MINGPKKANMTRPTRIGRHIQFQKISPTLSGEDSSIEKIIPNSKRKIREHPMG